MCALNISEPSKKENIIVIGLPGSGKTRVIHSLPSTFSQTVVEMPSASNRVDLLSDVQVWCVIDIRSFFYLPQDAWLESELKKMVQQADGIVFSFVEGASLEIQMAWSKWVKTHADGVPIVRWLNQAFPKEWAGFPCLKRGERKIHRVAPLNLQTFHFELGRISLEHLLFGLDSSKQNLGMKLLRVTGVLNTLEYSNLVAIEGSALRWDTFAAVPNAVARALTIQGIGLERTWLEELVQAAKV